jgi:hypothetical protein
MLNTNIVNEGCKSIEIVAVRVIGGYVVVKLDPPGVHEMVKCVGHQVEVKGGEVKDYAILRRLAVNCIGYGLFDIQV